MIHSTKIGQNTRIGERNLDEHITSSDLVNIYDSTIGSSCNIAAFVEIGGSTVGNRCKIQAFVFIPPGCVIEDDVFIGPHVCFCNVKYPSALVNQKDRLSGAYVECGAVIGANSTILPGIRIGRMAVIGAGSVVTRDVPSGATVIGNPARSSQ